MMTLNKRASHGDIPRGRVIVPENNGLVGNELLTARERHQRDLFSGDLGIPPIPPPPPLPGTLSASRQRTHVGSVVQTFETLAMQRRLAAFKQHEQQHQQQQKPQLNKIKNATQKQHHHHHHQQQQQNIFSKYLKSNNRCTTNMQMRKDAENNNNFSTKIKYTNNNTTFNERNKQISQQYLRQMEIDYRKNLFGNQTHVNNNNSNNTSTISEGEAGVVARFDEMLAGYSTTAAGEDDDDNNNNHHNDDMYMENSARVSIININSNEAQDNVLHINLTSTNGLIAKPANVTDNKTTTTTTIKQLNCSNTNQRLLPIMRKKPAPPLPPPKPQTKLTTATTTMTSTASMTANQHHESYNNVLSQHHNKYASKCAVDNVRLVENNDFLRGSTLSQSFVCQSNWQHNRKKPKAPKPPILPITTPIVQNITKNKQIRTNTQLRIAITNPFRHVLRLNSKRSDSFNLLKPNAN